MTNPMTDEQLQRLREAADEADEAFQRYVSRPARRDTSDWRVSVPPYDHDGVVIERFQISARSADLDQLRAAFNPQRGDRSVEAGRYTRLAVDGQLWMTDTPAECEDHFPVDDAIAGRRNASVLIVGLGLGVVLQRAIDLGCTHIEVVERDQRIIDAVGPHYQDLAAGSEAYVYFHHADIHQWRAGKGSWWDVVWLDIWSAITDEDIPEARRLKHRFRRHADWVGAWADAERAAMKRRIAAGYAY